MEFCWGGLGAPTVGRIHEDPRFPRAPILAGARARAGVDGFGNKCTAGPEKLDTIDCSSDSAAALSGTLVVARRLSLRHPGSPCGLPSGWYGALVRSASSHFLKPPRPVGLMDFRYQFRCLKPFGLMFVPLDIFPTNLWCVPPNISPASVRFE